MKPLAAVGGDIRRQFKRDVTNGDSLAAEMAAGMISVLESQAR